MEREAAGDSEEMSWAARRSRRSLQRPSFHVDKKPDISVSRNTFSSMDQSSGRDLQLSLVIRGYKSALITLWKRKSVMWKKKIGFIKITKNFTDSFGESVQP